MRQRETITDEQLALDTLLQQVEEVINESDIILTPPELAPHTSLLEVRGHPYADMMVPSRYKIYYGGRDSAKSWTMAEAIVKKMLFERHRILCCREYQNSIADSVHKLLKDTISRLGLESCFRVTRDTIRCIFSGSEALFKGLHNNVQEIKSTEGITICWVEEAHLTSEDSWQILIPTIRREGSEIWATFNVTAITAPTYRRFITNKPENAIVHHVNFDQNPFLTETSRQEIQYLMENDYAAYEHVYLGHPKLIDDAVIFNGHYRVENFSDSLADKADRLFYGTDFGFAQDPTTFLRSFIYDNTLYVEYEKWGKKIEFHGLLNSQGQGEIEQFYDGIKDSRRWPIKGDGSRPETISFIRGLGFNISAAEKWQGSVEDGITHLKGFKEIILHPRCKETIQEFGLYSYKRDRVTNEVLPIIVDKFNHCIDSLRYSLDGYIQRRGAVGLWSRLGRA